MRTAFLACALLPVLGVPSPAPPLLREQRLRYDRLSREVGRYQYVPFRVPAGTTRLTVTCTYDRAGGANAIDLGLFEPGPLDFGTAAFRGWSGGTASTVLLSTARATPGYWPGPLPAGEWHVMLGLYKVAPQGVDVTLTVETSSAPEEEAVPALAPRPTGPVRAGPAWFSGGLHVHTVHSDGKHTTADVARRAREAGHDFIVITDHNNTTHQLDPVDEPEVLRIVGEEVTTPGGHANVLGIGGWRDFVDFRLIAGDERIKDLVRDVAARGALFVINHPRAECDGCAWEHLVPDGVTAVEITDGGRGGAGVAYWDALLRRGRRVAGIGSSDWHAPDHPIGMASVRVWARDLSEAAILEGLRAGRVVVMADGATLPPEIVVRWPSGEARVGGELAVPSGSRVTVEVATPAVLARGRVDLVWDGTVVDSAATALATPTRFERTVDKDAYVRAHVYAGDGTPVAITNPVWLRATRSK